MGRQRNDGDKGGVKALCDYSSAENVVKSFIMDEILTLTPLPQSFTIEISVFLGGHKVGSSDEK